MKTLNLLALAATTFVFFAFTIINTGGIQGKIVPSESAKLAVAISGRDTLTTQINSGSFKFSNLKAGTYTVWIKRDLPKKDTSVVNIAVIDEATTDIGTIQLLP